MSALESTIVIRAPGPGDVAFIFSSWLKSYRSSPWALPMHNNTYYKFHHALIEDLMKNSDIYLACSKANPTDIYGYSVGQYIDGVFTLHFVYVKQAFRKLGICNLLLQCFERSKDSNDEEFVGCYTHHTHMADKLTGEPSIKLAQKYNLMYNPYMLANIDQQDLLVEGLESAINEDPIPVDLEPELEGDTVDSLMIKESLRKLHE